MTDHPMDVDANIMADRNAWRADAMAARDIIERLVSECMPADIISGHQSRHHPAAAAAWKAASDWLDCGEEEAADE